MAEGDGHPWLICDGSPGIGCPVIASIVGADLALAVTEPTLSGLHDLERVCELTRHFGVTTAVCINKADLNADLSARIEAEACQLGARVVGRIRYDPAVTRAQMMRASVVEYTGSGVAQDIQAVWRHVVYAPG